MLQFEINLMLFKGLMNKIDEMWPICHDCPYWEVCEPPYICEATEQKMKIEKTDVT